jgi:hypothetical protein
MQPDDCYLDWMNIGIRKEAETDSACVYLFICTRYRRRTDDKRTESLGEVIGKFAIDKRNGTTSLVEPMPGDERARVYERASHKIIKHWVGGDLPESAIYCAG